MSDQAQGRSQLQNQFTDEFLYFFLRLRKDRIRKVVQRVRDEYPGESTEQLARRLISSKSYLSWISGTLTHLPMLLPGVGQALKLFGFVGGASMLTRMHLYLILEMALLYGKDIDHDARIPEMAAVVGAVGVGASAPFLVRFLDLHPLYALPAAAISATAMTQLIGEAAISLYSNGDLARSHEAVVSPEAVL